ncbi:reverse transcriptase domain-containing protein, partial [Tanacetum coccineum]
VEVLQKSLEELRQARTRDKDLLEKAKEDNKQYEEKLEVSFDNEGRNGERVGTFFFPADFVVVDYVADPRVPLILGRPFLRTARALIDVHGEQMTLRHDDQSVTFKVGDTKTFSYNIIESVNRVDVIDIACEEYVQEVLEIPESGNPASTPKEVIF